MYSTITIPTLSLSGSNSIWMEINPNNDQPEKYHFNNFFNLSFGVNPDKINPLLDVTFDGIRIMNGDIVSAKPDVLITLKDENKFLAINDTSLFNLYLIEPDDANRIPLYFAETPYYKLEFTPASLPSNRAKINYKPSFTKDGVYQLVVQGKDVSGNRSGSNEYKISFEIVTKSTITEVLNYPNPFSTSTRFVFTLTGSEIPTYFKIQILSISGKVVREIDLSELGSIHIGRNITEYAWDGTDSFGDKLANGVYFYKVVTNINGQTIEKRETKADTFFKKGFGKLYIMR
jgi:flagellar hook assembly protein FlgD